MNRKKRTSKSHQEEATPPAAETINRRDKRKLRRIGHPHVELVPMTQAQADYLSSLGSHSLTIAEGPAGTGKTYIAVSYGLKRVLAGEFAKLVITRRAIEADEDKIGFLPGDKYEKLYEYMRPAIDVLALHMGILPDIQSILATGLVEIEHLGSLRGRTFHRSFVILDEAQNTTDKHMRMFLTRMGNGCRTVVCGDVTQNDLPKGKKSGLKAAIDKLGGESSFALHRFTEVDVQRSEMVKKVLELWPEDE